jgi:DNA-binding MarR family transcriptional regulator
MEPDKVDQFLQQWLRERPDLDCSPMGIVGRLDRLSGFLEKAVDDELKKFELSRWSFDVLAGLRRSGAPYRLSPNALLENLMITSGTMTNRIDQLERAGLVERQLNPSDRRSVWISLTARGLALIDHAVTAHIANEQRMLSTLAEDERTQLAGLLRKLLGKFENQA